MIGIDPNSGRIQSSLSSPVTPRAPAGTPSKISGETDAFFGKATQEQTNNRAIAGEVTHSYLKSLLGLAAASKAAGTRPPATPSNPVSKPAVSPARVKDTAAAESALKMLQSMGAGAFARIAK